MRKEINNLMTDLKSQNNPKIISSHIGHFIVESLRSGEICLYEAFMINNEALRYARMGYIQPAWSGSVYISTCISILNQKLVADIFNEFQISKNMKEYAMEAYSRLKSNRSHYITDRYMDFLDANEKPDLLKLLLNTRRKYDCLPFDDGPFHTEYFPFDYFSPEEILLDNKAVDEYRANKYLHEDIEDLLVEINLI